MAEVETLPRGADAPLMSKRQVLIAVIGCFATLLLALLDQNVVSAVSWTMARKLDPVHGVDQLPWLLTAYTLADCIVLPLYGKLTDAYGAKRVYLSALGIFLTGSVLCGLSQSMPELIAFRALQGVGGGGLMSVTMVILAQLVGTGSGDRSSGAGLGGVMVGLGLALGPGFGGQVADHLTWRWVFYINLPLGIAACVTAAILLRLPVAPVKIRIDYLGAALIAAAASALLLVSQWGGRDHAWTSSTIIGLGGAGMVLLGAFVWRQHSAAEPILSLALLRNRAFRVMAPLGFLAGIGLAGSVAYMAGYLQEARGLSPAAAGLWLLPMAGGMTLIGLLSGRAMKVMAGRHRFQLCAGYALIIVAMLLFRTLDADSGPWALGIGLFLLGTGLGLCLGIGLMIAQGAVDAVDLGSATTSLRFVQQLGASAGLALFGTVFNRELAAHLTAAAGAADAHGQLNTAALATLQPAQLHAALGAIVTSTHTVFTAAACVMVLPAVLSLFLRERSSEIAGGELVSA